MNTIKPITPMDAVSRKQCELPDVVIETWNSIIVKNLKSDKSVVGQEEIVKALVSNMDCKREDVFSKDWLEIEDLYRDVGWKVSYIKPIYYEECEAYFTFTIPS